MTPHHRVIFLCTGNYYRSRYAELYFNAHVPAHSVWRAVSRGFRITPENEGPIAPAVLERLRRRQIAVATLARAPRQLQPQELADADRVIVMDESEHRPYVEQDLPAWRSRVTYWHVPDVGHMPVEQAFELIEAEVNTLLRQV
jgi:protein-tyrosine phosphatase